MASPAIAGTVATTSVTTAATSLSINLPGSIAAGETLFIFARFPVAGTNAPTGFVSNGWTLLKNDTGDSSGDRTIVAYKKATGSEGATLAITADTNTKVCALAFRISGAADPTVNAPESSSANYQTGSNGAVNAITPSGGSKDYLYLAVVAKEGEDGATFSWLSGGFTGLNSGNMVNTGTGGSTATNAGILGGYIETTGTTTHGAGTVSIASAGNSGSTGFQIAVYPSGPPSLPIPFLRERRPKVRSPMPRGAWFR